MQVGQGTSFTQIYNQFKPGPLGNADQHLRLTGTNLHTHNPLMPHGKGAAALQARLEKYDNAAVAVKNAIAQEYGPAVADRVFRNLGLGSEVRLRDLRAIKAEIERLPVLDIETYRREGAGIDRGEMLSAAVEGRDPALEDALDAFSQKTQTSDSLQFLRAVHDYRQNPTEEKAQKIVGDFFSIGHQVSLADGPRAGENLFSEARAALRQDGADPHAFDRLYQRAFAAARDDMMLHFVTEQRQASRQL